MDAKIRKMTRGIYEKYKVKRTDGNSAPGKKHFGCSYFVLDLTHDPFSLSAIEAYAEACKNEFPALSCNLRDIARKGQPEAGIFAGKLIKKRGIKDTR